MLLSGKLLTSKKGFMMDIKTSVILEVEKDGHVFSLSMPSGAPFGKAYDAAFDFLQKIIELSKQAADQAQQKKDDSVTN